MWRHASRPGVPVAKLSFDTSTQQTRNQASRPGSRIASLHASLRPLSAPWNASQAPDCHTTGRLTGMHRALLDSPLLCPMPTVLTHISATRGSPHGHSHRDHRSHPECVAYRVHVHMHVGVHVHMHVVRQPVRSGRLSEWPCEHACACAFASCCVVARALWPLVGMTL